MSEYISRKVPWEIQDPPAISRNSIQIVIQFYSSIMDNQYTAGLKKDDNPETGK